MKFGLFLFVGSLVGSLSLVYFRSNNPIVPANGSWHGFLIVLACVILAEFFCRFVLSSTDSYRKVLLGIFILANLGAIPARVVAGMNQLNSEAAFALHFQGVFGALYGMAFVVLGLLVWQRISRTRLAS